jgi:hypothetical protein
MYDNNEFKMDSDGCFLNKNSIPKQLNFIKIKNKNNENKKLFEN